MTVMVPLQHELGPFTTDDWHALAPREDGSRLELLEGNWLVTPPPTGQHQWAEGRLLGELNSAITRAEHRDLFAVGGIGVEISTRSRSALIPDIAVLNVRPLGAAFQPDSVVLAGEIWSPRNSYFEQHEKHAAYAGAGIPFFWDIAQDTRGPIALTAHRLQDDHYVAETTVKLGDGPVTITASPVAVEIDVASLRP